MASRWRRQWQHKPRPPALRAHRRQPKTPLGWTAEKRFYGNPPRDHVTHVDAQSPLTSARGAAFCPPLPRPLPPPPPSPSPAPFLQRVRTCALRPARSLPPALPGWEGAVGVVEEGWRRARS